MDNLFAGFVVASVLTLLFVVLAAYAAYRRARQRTLDAAHEETSRLLATQERISRELQEANRTLRSSEERLSVTLASIGDAVVATDAEARVTRLNPVAEQLTRWTHADAVGRPVDEVIRIINQDTREPATVPVMKALAHGTIQGLANHTILIARDGTEIAIADSCAPIRDRDGVVVGAVLVFRNVTEEYAAQQALRDSAALVRTILNTVVDGIVTFQASGNVIEMANPAVEILFGYTADELRGKDFGVLVPELDRDQRHGSLEYYGASDEARALGLGREVVGRRKDGSALPLEIAVSEMWQGGQRYFTAIVHDLTDRRRAEEELRKAGALQNAIFNSANFSCIATDAKGVIQIFNVGAERMLGYAAADVMNRNTPADLSDPDEVIARAAALSLELGTSIAPGFDALVFKASRGIEDIYEMTYIRKDGSRFPAVVSVTALRDAADAIIGFLLIGTDNTVRKRIEAEQEVLAQGLLDKNTELESARRLADKANLAKSEFLSGMSHELRSPLNAILGFAQLMDSDTPPATPDQKASIEQILHAGWYLLDLINEILDLAVVESGKLSLSVEPVSLGDVLSECQAMVEPEWQQRGLEIRFPRFDRPVYVLADRTRLKQVLINLLSNAIKYNRPGGKVVVDWSSVTPEHLRIDVRDTGIGLSRENLAQLFQPFNRLGQESRSEVGTGIGLVMSKLLVEMMGGVIGVESTLGVGSDFWFEMTAAGPPRLEPVPGEAAAPIALASAGAPLRTLLYVEDNRANLYLVEQLIARRQDLRLLSAGDGDVGVRIARESRPDVILMDINLPGMSGIDALKVLRGDPATAGIPVIAISANAMLGDIEKGREAGFFHYLTKPINVGRFMETLDGALRVSGSHAACETGAAGTAGER